jgi:hypothetical protein
MNKFWMVYNPNGSMPTNSHATKEIATEEAKRLAAKHPGERFVVLESEHECVAEATIKIVTHFPTPEEPVLPPYPTL